MKPALFSKAEARGLGNLLLLVADLILVATGQAQAGTWTGTLHDGSVLQVDPETHRPMRYYEGGTAPMWDGTHQLEDGSVVIVRDGQVVPTEGMINTWTAQPGSEPKMRERHCERLVRKVCGFHNECATAQPCVLANQLLRMEREQQRSAPIGSGPFPQTESSSECLEAFTNPNFPACGSSVPETRETACRKLIDLVCGEDGRCAESPGCDPARQLLQMENEERLESADPDARTPTGAECEKARENAFFKPCE